MAFASPERPGTHAAGGVPGGAAMSYREGIYEALSLLSGEWVVAVLASLATQPLKYKELREEINRVERQSGANDPRQVSQKVLSATLRRMRRDGLVARSAQTESSFNPVWYELTPLGQTLLMSLRPVAKWAQDSHHQVENARVRYAEDEGVDGS
jgi:DNA-binding HxlR family transcriptional regulator